MATIPPASPLRAYFGDIQASVSAGLTTAQIWNVIQNRAIAETGAPVQGASLRDFNAMRSVAVQVRDAAARFAKAADNLGIEGYMVGHTLDAAPALSADVPRDWLVQFEHTFIQDGQQVTEWRTSKFRGLLPPTVGALRSQIEQDGLALADEYHVTHVGTGSLHILAA